MGRRIAKILWTVVTSLAAAALCLGCQFWLSSLQTLGGGLLSRYAAEILLRWGVTGYSERISFCTLLFYLLLTPAVVYGYWLLVLRPRRLGPWNARQKKAVAGVLGAVAVLTLLVIPSIFESVVPNASWVHDWSVALYMLLLALHTLLALAGVAGIVVTDRRSRRAPPAPAREAKRYGLCVVLVPLVFVSTACITDLMGAGWQSSGYIAEAGSVSTVVSMLLFAPLMEECFFRGILFGRLERCLPFWAAAIFSAFFFGVWHRDEVAFVYTLVPGLAFAALYHKTGRLRYGMLAHFLNNLLGALQGPPQGSVLPSLTFLVQWRAKLLRLPAPASAAVLAVCLTGMVLLLWKLFPAGADPAPAAPEPAES